MRGRTHHLEVRMSLLANGHLFNSAFSRRTSHWSWGRHPLNVPQRLVYLHPPLPQTTPLHRKGKCPCACCRPLVRGAPSSSVEGVSGSRRQGCRAMGGVCAPLEDGGPGGVSPRTCRGSYLHITEPVARPWVVGPDPNQPRQPDCPPETLARNSLHRLAYPHTRSSTGDHKHRRDIDPSYIWVRTPVLSTLPLLVLLYVPMSLTQPGRQSIACFTQDTAD